MVDERVTDGRRIAQLLASEVRGHGRGPLGPLEVTDVVDVEPGADGERAYRLVTDDAAADDGPAEPVASVAVHSEYATLVVAAAPAVAEAAAADAGLGVEPADATDEVRVAVASGAAVKRAVDVLRAVLESRDDAG